MGVSSGELQATVKANRQETGPGGLPNYLAEQSNKPFWRSSQERNQAFREMVSGGEKTISDDTFNTYAGVLTDEFLSLQDAVKLDSKLSASLPPWQKNLVEVVSHEFTKTNGSYQYDAQNKKEIYDAYHSVFDQLLRSKDPEKARQWLVTAMLSTQRQIIALQLATGAQAKVIREADKIQHVPEPEAFAAAISQGTGVPLDQVSGDLGKLGKAMKGLSSSFVQKAGFLIGGTSAVLSGGESTAMLASATAGGLIPKTAAKVLEWWYKSDPGRKINWDDAQAVKKMWGKYQAESQKRIHSVVEIEFAEGGMYRPDRKYQIKGPKGGMGAKISLDQTQKAFLNRHEVLGTVHPKNALEIGARDEVSRELKDLLHAQQNSFYVQFDEQLRTEPQLNLLSATGPDPDIFIAQPNSGSVNPQIEGMPMFSVGLDKQQPIEKQLHSATDALIRGVDQERFDTAAKGELLDNVKAQITTLDTRATEVRLSDADQAKQTKLTEEKTQASSQIQEIETYEAQVAQLKDKDERISRLTTEIVPISTAQTAIATAESTIADKTVEKQQKEREAGRIRTEIDELRVRKTNIQGEIAQLTSESQQLLAKFSSDTATKKEVDTRVSSIDAQLKLGQQSEAELLAMVQERALLVHKQLELGRSINEFHPNRSRVLTSIKQKINEITDPSTGLDLTISQKQLNLEGANGIEGIIRSLDKDIAEAQKKKTEQEAVISSGQAKLAELKTLQSEKIDLEAKQRAILEALQRGRGLQNSLVPTDLADLKVTIKNELKNIEKNMGIIDSDLEIAKLGDQHQKEVLEVFRDEFLTSAKWDAIKSRARRPLSAHADLAALERPDSFSHLAVGKRNRPFVMPAYLRTMQVMGGDDVLGRTPEAQQTFAKLSKVITPELFFKVFTQDAKRSQALAQAIGMNLLPSNLSVYDDRLQDPSTLRSMIPLIDRHFTQELLKELVHQANDRDPQIAVGLPSSEADSVGKLGRLDTVTLERMKDVARMEKGMPKDVLQGEIGRAESEAEKAKHSRELATLRRKAESAKAIDKYVIQTLGLSATLSPTILDVVNQMAIKHNIQPGTVLGATEITDARNEFARKNITLTDLQVVDVIAQMRPLEMLALDHQAGKVLDAFDTLVTKWGIAGLKADTVDTHIRAGLALLGQKVPITSSSAIFGTKIEGKSVRDIILEGIGNANSTNVATALVSITDDQLAAVANEYITAHKEQSFLFEPQSTAESEVTHRFLARGGSLREALLLNSFVASLDRNSAREVQEALYRLESEKGDQNLDAVMERVTDPNLKTYLNSRRAYMEAESVNRYKLAKPQFTGTTFKDLPAIEVGTIIPNVVGVERAKGLGASLTTAYRSEEVRAIRREGSARISAENVRREVDALGAKFWGESGRSLVLAIEKSLGGARFRQRAIELAQAIEARRAHN